VLRPAGDERAGIGMLAERSAKLKTKLAAEGDEVVATAAN
jgi:hypothetical protein